MLGLAGNEKVSHLLTENSISKGLAFRFVAGETFEEALEIVRRQNEAGLAVTLDALGENVSSPDEAAAASQQYLTMLDGIANAKLNSTLSLKLTMLGLDISDDLCRANLLPVLERARELDTFVRIDMEGSIYTRRTLDLFYSLHEEFDDHVGIVLQSYLYRTGLDVEKAIEHNVRVRLVKGAYAEPELAAFTDRAEIDANYVHLMRLLLDGGRYPAIATHDPALIAATQQYARGRAIAPDRFEFQMLYGVRRDEQQRLVDNGYRMRVYVPFGTEWYPYFSRRIAERPANALFVLRQLRG
jgi:proline dehydrogenase